MSRQPWLQAFPAVQFRIAHPTDQLKEIIRFYGEGQSPRLLYAR